MHAADLDGVAIPVGRKTMPRVLGDCIPGDVVSLPDGERVVVCNPNIAGAVFVRALDDDDREASDIQPRDRDAAVRPIRLR
jgi:hypothetical protein